MSEQKLSERMNAEIKELILRGLPVTQSQALDWRDEVAALEAKLEATIVLLQECLSAKSRLYPPGASYLNNPDNMNDPRVLDERGNVVTP